MDGLIGGICLIGFDDVDAAVACSNFGYVDGKSLAQISMCYFVIWIITCRR